jgi:4'-phosphopantetheinyl transferase
VVDVVWAHPHGSAQLIAMLDDTERARLGSLHRSEDGARFVAGRALLRFVVAECWSIEPAAVALTFTCARCGAPHGPPVAVPPDGLPSVHLSLAHGGARVIVAVSLLGPVGVDVEAVTGFDFSGIDDVALAAIERASLSHVAPAAAGAARARIWVRKESVLKATGSGLACDPRLVVVSPPSDPPHVVEWPERRSPSLAQLTDIDVGLGYAACLTLLAQQPARVQLRCADGWLRGDL